MAEPVSHTAAALTLTGVGSSGLTLLASTMGVSPMVVICAVLGALGAVAAADRVDLSLRGIAVLLTTFAVAFAIGAGGGPFLGGLLVAAVNSVVSRPLPSGVGDALCSVLLALLGQRELLPVGLQVLRGRAKELGGE